jgi:hypothetical protein
LHDGVDNSNLGDNRRGAISALSFAEERADCGAGFQPARAGKDACTTTFKTVGVRMPRPGFHDGVAGAGLKTRGTKTVTRDGTDNTKAVTRGRVTAGNNGRYLIELF